MHSIVVGKLYAEGVTSYPEGCDYNFSQNGHELRLFFHGLTREEKESVRRGAAEFSVFVYKSILFLLYKFKPNIPWSDAPYCWSVVPEEFKAYELESIQANQGVLMQIVLINADNGVVEAIRVITLDTELSRRLHAAIAEQIKHPITRDEYNLLVNSAYQQYPNTMDMVLAEG